jgi:LAO/AO transport system kinase
MGAAAPSPLGARLRAGDKRALARAISVVERDDEGVPDLLREATAGRSAQRIVGITGPPGVGKSTLVDALTAHLRGLDRTVAVLAVDPSSPLTGGALLGDRVRMHRHALDPGVFVRSMGARGQSGGLAAATEAALLLIGACGFDEIVVETVGVGQSDHAVTGIVDTAALVLGPAAGDLIQLQKAGIMEIADVYVVNKGDLDGAAGLRRDLHRVVGRESRGGWVPPVLGTVARDGEGIAELWGAIEDHRLHLGAGARERSSALPRRREDVAALLAEAARSWALAELQRDQRLGELLDGSESPLPVAIELAARKGLPLSSRI